MRRLTPFLLILLLIVPSYSQSGNELILLNEVEFDITPNDLGEGSFSRYFDLLPQNTIIPMEKDEVLLELNISDHTIATGVEITMMNVAINENTTHPIQSQDFEYSITVSPLEGTTSIWIWIHWYSLLGPDNCDDCDFTNISQIKVRFFTENQSWESSVHASSRISHRERAVSLSDFVDIAIQSPGVDVGTASPQASYSSPGMDQMPNEDASTTSRGISELAFPQEFITVIGYLMLFSLIYIRYNRNYKTN